MPKGDKCERQGVCKKQASQLLSRLHAYAWPPAAGAPADARLAPVTPPACAQLVVHLLSADPTSRPTMAAVVLCLNAALAALTCGHT